MFLVLLFFNAFWTFFNPIKGEHSLSFGWQQQLAVAWGGAQGCQPPVKPLIPLKNHPNTFKLKVFFKGFKGISRVFKGISQVFLDTFICFSFNMQCSEVIF